MELPPSLDKPRATRTSRTAAISFGVLFALAVTLLGAVIWPFRVPLFFAFVLATVLDGVYGWTVRQLRGHRVIGALVTTLGVLVVVIGPLAAVVGFIAGRLAAGLAFIRDQLGINTIDQLRNGTLSANGTQLTGRALRLLHLSREQLEELGRRVSEMADHPVQRLVQGSSAAVFHTAIMLIAFYFFLLEGARLRVWLERISPLQPRQTRDLFAEFRSVARASIFGTTLAALFQAVAATVGYIVTGVPHSLFFGVLTLVASFIPVIGTMLIWAPAVGLLWVFGQHAMAIVLLAWCTLIVIGAEQVGKPFVMRAILRSREEIHGGLVFLSLLGGIEMFGLIGVVLGPLMVAFFLSMVRIYERDFREAPVAHAGR
jgi:predicted PurR-regulated permease PerM